MWQVTRDFVKTCLAKEDPDDDSDDSVEVPTLAAVVVFTSRTDASVLKDWVMSSHSVPCHSPQDLEATPATMTLVHTPGKAPGAVELIKVGSGAGGAAGGAAAARGSSSAQATQSRMGRHRSPVRGLRRPSSASAAPENATAHRANNAQQVGVARLLLRSPAGHGGVESTLLTEADRAALEWSESEDDSMSEDDGHESVSSPCCLLLLHTLTPERRVNTTDWVGFVW